VTPDVYDAWLTAGDTLRPYGDWIATNWLWLAAGLLILAAAVVVRWAVRDDYRSYNDRRAAWFVVCDGPRPEPPAPGSNEQWLATCNELCPDLARKEERP
jgi:hypothetical protein